MPYGASAHDCNSFTDGSAAVTTFVTDESVDPLARLSIPNEVYHPQEDSALLIKALCATGRAWGGRVADLCSGSGVVALAAADQGASSVAAFEMNPHAVTCARANAAAAGLDIRVYRGSWARATEFAPFDVVTCNPPYVPFVAAADDEPIPVDAGPETAWNAGRDGRLVLEPLCERAPELLARGGTILVVHSEFADVTRTVEGLRAGGLHADIVAEQWIPFGPVLSARAHWLERVGLLEVGRREERLAVVRGDRW
jgi:release factor glutamine methyltransferase